jgi:5-methylcytosine-specific restriction endonuclease McrA
MDLWLRAPYCDECILSYPFRREGLPDITEHNWENDIAWKLGEDALLEVQQELGDDPDFAFCCKRCAGGLAPWNGDAVHVVRYHLEEHYGIPLYTPGQKRPPEKLRKEVFKLYGNACFACGRTGEGLHIDHILPQSAGGDAAFRNLQPLCEACGQKKGDAIPEDVDVWSNIYFTRPPSDGYEGLFW